MLRPSISHADFLVSLDTALAALDSSQIERLKSDEFALALKKVRSLSFDPAVPAISSLYSSRGRPASDPTVLLRTLFLMFHFRETSVQKWHDRLKNDVLLQVLCGCRNQVPAVGTCYLMIDRLCQGNVSESILPADKNRKPEKVKKPKGKPGRKPKNSAEPADPDFSGTPTPSKKGEKLNTNQPGATTSLADQAREGEIDPDRFIKLLQTLLKVTAVDPSIQKGLINADGLTLSGDGTAIHVHADARGHHIKGYLGTDKFDTLRRYSDPDAGHGFDSDLGSYYFGYTGFFQAVHNEEEQVDLPLFFMIEPAKSHDSITAIKGLSQFRDLYPEIKIANYCLDSASDNEATFRLCLDWGITPVIDLNGRRGKDRKSGTISIDSKGIPHCQAGVEMDLAGFDKTHNAYKYRCPFAMGKIKQCPHWAVCSRTSYGRTFYQKCDNIREKTGLKYKSEKWKKIYANRTSCERVNNRVLNDYGVHKSKMRTARRTAFNTFNACLNIHADAWAKTSK